MTKVNFVSYANEKLASHRMRVQRPVELLNTFTDIDATITKGTDTQADLNIYFKHFKKDDNLRAVSSAEDFGYATIFDICDNHFEREEHSEYYYEFANRVQHITCNSANMQQKIYEITGKLARIIPDPITFPERPALVCEDPKLLWYGHHSNLKGLIKWLPFLKEPITTVTEKHLPLAMIRHVQWQYLLVENIISDFDIVLVPLSTLNGSICKSPNRAVDAIISGKYVIADNESVYGELKDFISIINPDGSDLQKTIEWYKNNPQEVLNKIKLGQQYVKEKFSNQAVLDGWLDAFKDVGLIKSYE